MAWDSEHTKGRRRCVGSVQGETPAPQARARQQNMSDARIVCNEALAHALACDQRVSRAHLSPSLVVTQLRFLMP